MPKAAMQDLHALNARARIQAEYLGYRPDDVVCAIVDFYPWLGALELALFYDAKLDVSKITGKMTARNS